MLVCGAWLLAGVAGCASGSVAGTTASGRPSAPPVAATADRNALTGTTRTPSSPIAVPPEEPCLWPTKADLLTLEQFSDVVVQATIDTPPVAASTGAWLTRLSRVTVISRKNTSALPTVQTLIDSDDPSSYHHPGTYIFFLSNDPGSDYYIVTDGLDGTFKISGPSITRECPNYGGTAPILATAAAAGASAVTTLANLKALIPGSLPAYSPPPKPTAVPSAPSK
jgi:hypothetical protein